LSRVLITGCSSGFGLGAARLFAERGDTVYATVRDPDKAVELRAAQESGLPIRIVPLDVRDATRAEAVVREMINEGGIEALVNNAGVSMFAAVEEVSIDLAQAVLETNYLGPLRLIRLVLPHMRAQRSGRIVNVCSTAGYAPVAFLSTYTASKQALDSMSLCLAAELHNSGIRVSLICPAAYQTGVGGNFWAPDTETNVPRYRETAERIVGLWKDDAANKDPLVVAHAIVEAVHAADPPVRVLVDDDARSAYELRRRMTDDEWVEQMATLGHRVGLDRP
jgi:NAD(P)-dependent dehydrogenase (short-subunit alcohol dehydrogenase family)